MSQRLPRVSIGMPIGTGSLPWGTALSLMNTVVACKEAGVPLKVEALVGCSVVTWARSAILDTFLKSDSELLFWIDSDIIWTVDDFFRLVGFAAVCPAVGATYPFKKLNPMSFFINHDGAPGEYRVNGHGLVKINGMGLGFFVHNREVAEKVSAGKTARTDPITGQTYADVFRIDHEGEDIAFMTDIRAAGYDIWLDPSISLGHIGNMIYKGDVIKAMGLEGFAKQEKQP